MKEDKKINTNYFSVGLCRYCSRQDAYIVKETFYEIFVLIAGVTSHGELTLAADFGG